jgi:hypothetical protein
MSQTVGLLLGWGLVLIFFPLSETMLGYILMSKVSNSRHLFVAPFLYPNYPS